MGEATEFAVQLEDAVLFEDAEPIADQDFEHHHANDLFVVPVDEGVRRRRENAAAVAARVLREGLQSETAARDALERDHESLVEQEKLLSKQLSVAKRQVEKLEQLLRQAEAVDERWSDDETTSDRRGLGLVIKREFAPNADAQERPRARRTKRPECKMTGKRWEEMRTKLDAATVRAVRASDVSDETIREVGKRQWETLFPNVQPPTRFTFGRSFIRDIREKMNVTTKRCKPTTTMTSMTTTKTAHNSSADEIDSPQTPRISKRARKRRFADGSWEL